MRLNTSVVIPLSTMSVSVVILGQTMNSPTFTIEVSEEIINIEDKLQR